MVDYFELMPGVQVHELDSCMPDKPVLVERRGKYLELRGDAKALIVLLKGRPATVEQIEAQLKKNDGAGWDQARILHTLNRLTSFSLVTRPSETGSPPGQVSVRPGERQLMLVFPLLQPKHLAWLTLPLSRLLVPRIIAWSLPVLLLVHLYAFIKILHPVVGSASSLAATVHTLRPDLFVALALGNYLGLFFHELGHAAACVRCQTSHGPIGVCLYWVLPGLYTEVNQTWKLPGNKRLIVDSAGIFFSLIAASVMLAAFMITGSSVCALLCAIYDVTVLINLVPFLRMDGYWIISDSLGIPNLMRANKELSQWAVLRLLGVEVGRPRIFGISRGRRHIYFAYYAGFLAFTLYWLWKVAAWYVPHLGHVAHLAFFNLSLSIREHQTVPALVNILKMALVALPAIGLASYYGRAMGRTLQWVRGVLGAGGK